MDPLHFCIAVVPLAVYLLMMGLLNLRHRPFLTTGARDMAALGVGIVGLMIAGPMELFFPESAASQFGAWVWIMLLVFYGLCVSLIVLLMRSRIVIYNVSMDKLRPALTLVAREMDRKSRWVGDSLIIPSAGVHLHAEPVRWLRNVQLTAVGHNQDQDGWMTLEMKLAKALEKIPVGSNLIGIPFIMISILLAVGTATWMLSDQASVASSFDNMWR
jgi:hypothetical protein